MLVKMIKRKHLSSYAVVALFALGIIRPASAQSAGQTGRQRSSTDRQIHSEISIAALRKAAATVKKTQA
jgi:hypothetical protein